MDKPERIFRMVADVSFSAIDINDALAKLSKHFKDIKEGRDSKLFLPKSHIDIRANATKNNH